MSFFGWLGAEEPDQVLEESRQKQIRMIIQGELRRAKAVKECADALVAVALKAYQQSLLAQDQAERDVAKVERDLRATFL